LIINSPQSRRRLKALARQAHTDVHQQIVMCHKIRNRWYPIVFFGFILFLALLVITGGCTTHRRVIKNESLEDWDGKRMRYKNLFPPEYGYLEETEFDRIDFRKPHEKGVKKYSLLTDPRGDIDRTKGYDPADYTVIPDFAILRNPVYQIQVTWIRHASFLVQLGGKYQILIDPVIEELDGLVGKLGKYSEIGTLYAEPPLSTEQLPFFGETDRHGENPAVIVAISHDHFDHLNFNTLKKLPENTHYYVPLGLENEFPSRFSNVTGMDWYTQDTIGDLTIHFLPANHRSGRSLYESDQSLWGGWLFEWNGYRVYFAGDTGYSGVFKDIKKRVGAADICLLPTTAWFQRHWHFAPEDAVRAAKDLECKVLIPWGWGTWIMSFEHILDPPRRLQYAWDRELCEDECVDEE
jgi:L-ascorbate metabolism protein UlaG (beta-lactamase superfamily)